VTDSDPKVELRRAALQRREALPDREARGRQIQEAVHLIDRFTSARVVSSYVGVKSEVATQQLIGHLLFHGTTVAVPWREGEELALVRLEALEELAPSSFGLLEPSPGICGSPDRELLANACDVLIIPGLAFDRTGARLGYGRGYYDRLLRRVRPDALRIGLAFDCQVVETVPTGPTDERVHLVVTEEELIRVSAPADLTGP